MTFEIENQGERHVRPTFQVRWPAQRLEGTDYAELSLAAWHDGTLETGLLGPSGGFLGIGGPLEKKEQFLENTHWAGSQFRYFVAAMIPENPRDASARFEPFAGGLFGATDLAFQAVDIPPGQSITRNIKIYIGPKEGKRLSRAGAHLEDAVPKGWFAPLTNFFLWFLDKLHQFIPNYGVAGSCSHGTYSGKADEIYETDGRAFATNEGDPGEVR
jgi:YidC/Oxa1 family membrane protein insertase